VVDPKRRDCAKVRHDRILCAVNECVIESTEQGSQQEVMVACQARG